MYDKNNTLSIGKLLKNAGLVSDIQLEKALLIQSQSTSMKVEKILVLQGIIKAPTMRFFGKEWPKIKQEGQHFPIGYYLQKAYLLNEEQIQNILEQQQNSNLKFGQLAVKKGWIGQKTVDFFLDAPSAKPPQLMSLASLEKYNQESLDLERKYADYSVILSRILAWTGGNANLTKDIARVFADYNLNISSGMEITAVDRLVESTLIRDWQTSNLGTYIRSIREKLVDNVRCNSLLLLIEYQEILLSGTKEYSQTAEQQELLTLGLVVRDGRQLRVTNLIFQQIFNRDWLIESIKTIEEPKQAKPISDLPAKKSTDITSKSILIKSGDSIAPFELPNNEEKQYITNTNSFSFITKLISLLTLGGLVLLVPLVLALDNYYSFNKDIKTDTEYLSEVDLLQQFCDEINLVDPPSSLNLIFELEKNQQKILQENENGSEAFPNNCQTALDRLRILALPQLGRENRVIEAIKNLCKIPADSESINEAKVWLEHWYSSKSWGKETKSYLNLVDDCPAKEIF